MQVKNALLPKIFVLFYKRFFCYFKMLIFPVQALDSLSNSVVELIDKGKLDEAEQACIELLNRYPDYIDGLERFALVYEARGDSKKAIEYYKKSADFARKNEGFDPEYVKWAMDKVKKLGG